MKKILKFILIICSVICIMLVVCSYILENTILSKSFVLKQIEKNDYYEKIYDLCYYNFENYIYQSGFDEKVIENIITKEKIKEDTNIVLNNIYNGNNVDIDTDIIKENIKSNIKKNYANFTVDEKNVNEFMNCLVKEYNSFILHTSYEEKIFSYIQKINKLVKILKYFSILILFINIIVLGFIDIKQKDKVLQNFEIIFLINFIIFFAIFFNIIYNVNVEKIQIFNFAFSILIKSILKNILTILIYIDAMFLIVSIIFIIILFRLYMKRNIENDKIRRIKWKKLI